MARRKGEYETAIIISGTDKGGIKVLQTTGEQVEELDKKQGKGAGTAEKYGKKHKEAGDDVGKFSGVVKKGVEVVVAAAAAAAGAITALVTVNTKVIAEQARTAQMLGISTQSYQAQGHAARMAGLDISEYGDVLRDVTVRVREFASIGTGEAADFFEALNLDIQDFKDLAPDELIAAIGQELEGLNRNDRLLFLDQLGSDQATKLVDVIHKLDEMEQEAIAIGVAMSDIDAEQVNQAAVGMEKVQSVAAGAANQITAGLAPIITDLTTRFYDAAVGAGGIESAVDAFVEGGLAGIGFVADRVLDLRKLLKLIEIGWLGIASIGTQALASNAEAVSALINIALDKLLAVLGKVAEGWAVILYGFSKVPGMPFADSILDASDTLRDFSKNIETFEVDAAHLNQLNEATRAGLASAREELEELINTPPPSDGLAEWYENVKQRAEELAEQTLEANQSQGENVEVTNQQQTAVKNLVEQMEFENSLLGLTSLEQKIQNNLRKAGADATDEQRAAIRRLTIERHREEEAIADVKQETERLAEVQSNQMENFQREFSKKVVETIKTGRLELESIVDILENGLVQGVGDWISSGVTNMVFGQGGGGQSEGLGGSIINAFGLAGLAGGAGGAAGSFSLGAVGTTTGGWVAPSMAAPGTAGAAGGGGIMSSVGGFLTSPVGIAAMVGIAGKLIHDKTSNPDGFTNSMAGMLVAPTPGANQAGLFDVDAFASGFKPTGFADRRSREEAIAAIDEFRELDGTLNELVQLLGGNAEAMRQATLAGLNVEGVDGTDGTFLGLGGRTQSLDGQKLLYARQFAKHIEGIDQSLLDAIDTADSYEQVIQTLMDATKDMGLSTDTLAGTEKLLARVREASRQQILESMRDLGVAMEDLASLQRQIENDIFAAQGISTLYRDAAAIGADGSYVDQLANIDAQRQSLLQQHAEQIAHEQELHAERVRAYEQELAMAGRLNDTVLGILTGSNSPLSNQDKFQLLGSEFERLAGLAESGDMEAAGKLSSVADSFVEAIRRRFASSSQGDVLVNDVVARLSSIQEQFAGAEDPGAFSPASANQALVAGLESLQQQVTEVHDAIATDAVNQLVQLNSNILQLPDQIATAQNLPDVLAAVSQQLVAGGLPITVLADQIAQSLVLTGAANTYLAGTGGGTVSDYTSSVNEAATPDLIREYADQVVSRHGGATDDASREFIETAQDNAVGSKQVAEALGLDQTDVVNLAKRLGLPEFAEGGIVTSPTVGLIAETGRHEGIFPLPSDYDSGSLGRGRNSDVVVELRELNTKISTMAGAIANLAEIEASASETSAVQREHIRDQLNDLGVKLEQKGVGSRYYAKPA